MRGRCDLLPAFGDASTRSTRPVFWDALSASPGVTRTPIRASVAYPPAARWRRCSVAARSCRGRGLRVAAARRYRVRRKCRSRVVCAGRPGSVPSSTTPGRERHFPAAGVSHLAGVLGDPGGPGALVLRRHLEPADSVTRILIGSRPLVLARRTGRTGTYCSPEVGVRGGQDLPDPAQRGSPTPSVALSRPRFRQSRRCARRTIRTCHA